MIRNTSTPRTEGELALRTSEAGAAAFRALCYTSGILAFLDSLSCDELTNVSRRSYIHNNGFVKIVLQDYSDGSALRLHVWPNADAGDESDVHSHRWSFKSGLLCGRMEQSTYNVSADGPMNWYEFLTREHGRRYQMSLIGSANADLTTQFIMTPGFTYKFYAGAYHSIRILAPPTATVVLTSPPQADSSYVLKPRHIMSERRIAHLSVLELKEVIDLLRDQDA
jgi:hypothetical protein